jgi:hypothetical protein
VTIIAYRNGVIAADTGMTSGDSRFGRISKIARSPSGDLGGAAGTAAYSQAFCQWVALGCPDELAPTPKEDANNMDRGVVFRTDGVIVVHEPAGTFTCSADYFALGSGRPEALGAMFMGGTAIDAVRAAMKHDANSFGDVEVLAHEQHAVVAA